MNRLAAVELTPRNATPGTSSVERILAAVAYAAQQLLLADEHPTVLDDVLERLGSAAGVSRAYVFSVTPDGDELLATQRYEWVAEGVEPQQGTPELIDLPLRASGFGDALDALLAGEAVARDVTSFEPAATALLTAQDIHSVLLVPIRVDRALWGFMGFDECTASRCWTASEVAALTTAAGVVGGSIQQDHAREMLRASERAYAAAYGREREATARLRTLDGMKDAFLEAVSHELRTPLTAVLGFAETLQRVDASTDPEHAAELVERLVTNARRLRVLLDDLVDLDQLTRGALVVAPRAVDLPATVRAVVEEFAPALRGRAVTVSVAIDTAVLDPAKFHRILANLLQNATRHTPPATPVTVRVWRGDGRLQLAVEDTGPGIPDDHKSRVFEPFQQGPDVSRHSPGTGVGLSVVARYAVLHGGRAWIEDRPGGGTVVRVTLSEDVGTSDGHGGVGELS